MARALSSEDFSDFSGFLNGLSLEFPDQEFHDFSSLLPTGSVMMIKDLKCDEFSINDIIYTYTTKGDNEVSMKFDVSGISIKCLLNWVFSSGPEIIPLFSIILPGNGNLVVDIEDIFLSIEATINSEASFTIFPSSAKIDSCELDFTLESIDISGSLPLEVLDIIVQIVKPLLVLLMRPQICDLIRDIGGSELNENMKNLSNCVGNLETAVTAPLSVQNEMSNSALFPFIDFSNMNYPLTRNFNNFNNRAKAFLDRTVFDDNVMDLAINILLRAKLLTCEEYLVNLIFDELPFLPIDDAVYNGTTSSPNVTVFLSSLRIKGLDSFNSITPIETISKQTHTTTFGLDEIEIESDFRVEMGSTSSSLPPDVVNFSFRSRSEDVRFKISINDLKASVSFFIGLNQYLVENLQIKSILHTNCSLPFISQFNFTHLDTSFASYNGPEVEGLISPGVDKLVMDISDSLGDMLNSVELLPILIKTLGKDVLQDKTEQIFACYSQNTCPQYTKPVTYTFLDFRNLLLNETSAKEAGASGLQPYGDLVSSVMDLFNAFLFPDKNGDPFLNKYFIGPITRFISNTTGHLNIATNTGCKSTIDENQLIVQVINIDVDNLNTTAYPLRVFSPRLSDPYILDTEVTIGSKNEPLQITVRFSVSFSEIDVVIYNEMEVTVELQNVELLLSILAKIDEQSFMELSLFDIANPFCWGAMISGPNVLENGKDAYNNEYPFIYLDDFRLAVAETRLTFKCISCETSALTEVSKVLDMLKSAGTLDVVISMFYEIVVENALLPENLDLFNQLLGSARIGCPSDPKYDPQVNMSIPETFDCLSILNTSIPVLSRNTFEFFVLLGTVAVHAGLALFPKILHPEIIPSNDPLSAQHSFNSKNADKLFNFEDYPSLDVINPFLGELIGEDGNRNRFDLQINLIIRSFLLNPDGSLQFSIPPVSFEVGGFVITLDTIRITGMDTFFSFDVLSVLGPQTIQSNMGIESLQVDLPINVNMTRSNEMETMTVSITLEKINVKFALFMALYLDELSNFQIGSLLSTKAAIPCILSVVDALNLTDIYVSIGNIGDIEVRGVVSSIIENAIRSSSKSIFKNYKEEIASLLPGVFTTFVRSRVNEIIEDFLSQPVGSCPKFDEPNLSTTDLIDFRDLFLDPVSAANLGGSGTMPYGDVMFKMLNFIDGVVFSSNENGAPKLNENVIGPLTRLSSSVTGLVRYQETYFNGKYLLIGIGAKNGTCFSTKAFDVRVENLDSIGYPLSLLEPSFDNPYTVDNGVAIGVDKNLKVTTRFVLGIENTFSKSHNDMNVSIELKDLVLLASLLVKVRSQSFMAFPLRDVTNPNCWLSMIPPRTLNDKDSLANAALAGLNYTIQKVRLGLQCVSCSSLGYEDLDNTLSSPAAVSQSTGLLMFLQSAVLQNPSISKYIQYQVDLYLNDVAKLCPHHPDFSSNQEKTISNSSFKIPENGDTSYKEVIIVFVVIVVIIVSIIISYQLTKRAVSKRYVNYLKSLQNKELLRMKANKAHKDLNEKRICEETKSMLKSEDVPTYVRYGFPLVTLVNIAFFLSGHIDNVASINIYLDLAGEMNFIPDFYSFNIVRAITDVWESKARLLSIIITFTSIIWPYVKQLTSLYLWCAPPSSVSVKRRGSAFVLLDSLGKWSIFDLFTMIMFICAFSVKLYPPKNLALIPEGFFYTEIALDIQWGFFANMIAQLISQICSHFVIHYHRNVVKSGLSRISQKQNAIAPSTKSPSTDERSTSINIDFADNISFVKSLSSENSAFVDNNDHDYENYSSERFEALCNHTFCASFKDEKYVKIPQHVNRLFMLFCMGTFCILLAGISIPSVKFEMTGLAGYFIEFGSEDASRITKKNLFDVVTLLMEQTKIIGSSRVFVGRLSISILLLFSTFFVGVALICILAIMWFMPMGENKRKRFRHAVEILQSWQYMDVYILALLAIATQLGAVVTFMGEDYCPYEFFFSAIAHFNILTERDARCFYIITSLDRGVYILILYSCMLFFMRKFVLSAMKQYENEIKSTTKKRTELMKDIDLAFIYSDNIDHFDAISLKTEVKCTDMFRWLFMSQQTTGIDKPIEIGSMKEGHDEIDYT